MNWVALTCDLERCAPLGTECTTRRATGFQNPLSCVLARSNSSSTAKHGLESWKPVPQLACEIRESEVGDSPAQAMALDLQRAGGLALVAAELAKRHLDQSSFRFLQRHQALRQL